MPFNIRYRIEAGHIDFVNEVRVCTVVFFGFPFLGPESTARGVDPVQVVTATTQSRMHQDGGFFLQMRYDDKGLLALCAFGLPGRAHEDSPARGVISALAVVSALQRQGHVAVAGVTTGNLFCAEVGSQRRAEYTVFGDAINLAARLMTQAPPVDTCGAGDAYAAGLLYAFLRNPHPGTAKGRGRSFLVQERRIFREWLANCPENARRLLFLG